MQRPPLVFSVFYLQANKKQGKALPPIDVWQGFPLFSAFCGHISRIGQFIEKIRY